MPKRSGRACTSKKLVEGLCAFLELCLDELESHPSDTARWRWLDDALDSTEFLEATDWMSRQADDASRSLFSYLQSLEEAYRIATRGPDEEAATVGLYGEML